MLFRLRLALVAAEVVVEEVALRRPRRAQLLQHRGRRLHHPQAVAVNAVLADNSSVVGAVYDRPRFSNCE